MDMSTLFQLGQIGGMLVLATLFIVMIKADVKVLKAQMDGLGKVIKVQTDGIAENLKILNNSFSQLSEVLSRSAVQDSRLTRVEEDIRELRHGRGFVQREIDGEYTTRGKVKS